MAGRCGDLRDKKQMELMLQQAYCTQSFEHQSQQANATAACFGFGYTFKLRGESPFFGEILWKTEGLIRSGHGWNDKV